MSVISSVRPWGGPLSDVEVTNGKISAVRAHEPHRIVEDKIEGRNRLLLPSFSDLHVHLDSTRLGLPFRPHTGGADIWSKVMNDRENWRNAEKSATERAAQTLAMMIAHGTTRLRSFAQVDADCRLQRFEAVAEARSAHEDRCTVQIVAFPQAGLLLEEGVVPLMEQALREGADVVGGIDPCQLDRDPIKHLDIVFDLAERFRVPVDLHLHEKGELGAFTAELIMERTRALGMQGNVTISHAFFLGGASGARSRKLMDDLAALEISLTTVAPPGDQGLPLAELTAAGLRVGLGEDGQRDYWSPYGDADMLSRTWQLAFTNNYSDDDLIGHCLAVATIGGASILGAAERLKNVTDRPGLDIGDAADLILLDGETVTSAVMDRPSDRTIIHAGRIVADQLKMVP